MRNPILLGTYDVTVMWAGKRRTIIFCEAPRSELVKHGELTQAKVVVCGVPMWQAQQVERYGLSYYGVKIIKVHGRVAISEQPTRMVRKQFRVHRSDIARLSCSVAALELELLYLFIGKGAVVDYMVQDDSRLSVREMTKRVRDSLRGNATLTEDARTGDTILTQWFKDPSSIQMVRTYQDAD
ncbi:hypothetical protein [Vibrio phage V-YDF132]|nr:hypothetical protein [Vibrio phage V-YDF132]